MDEFSYACFQALRKAHAQSRVFDLDPYQIYCGKRTGVRKRDEAIKLSVPIFYSFFAVFLLILCYNSDQTLFVLY